MWIEILNEEKFSYMENVLPLLKDKAIYVLRSKVVESYLSDTLNKGTKRIDTRLLLFYLFTDADETGHRALVEQYEDDDDVPRLFDNSTDPEREGA